MSRMFRMSEEDYKILQQQRKAPLPQGLLVTPHAPAKKDPSAPSAIHIRMRQQIEQAGLIPPVEEYYHIKGRDFRLDFAWPFLKIGVEVQGMAHRIKSKFNADIEKRALGLLSGWRVLEANGDSIRNEQAIKWLKQLMENHGIDKTNG